MASWSETGDRYLLKLFRDFVFHQAVEDGAPKIDWGHVVECLNKVRRGRGTTSGLEPCLGGQNPYRIWTGCAYRQGQ
jgi:hypothetical protein